MSLIFRHPFKVVAITGISLGFLSDYLNCLYDSQRWRGAFYWVAQFFLIPLTIFHEMTQLIRLDLKYWVDILLAFVTCHFIDCLLCFFVRKFKYQ